jgi:hypothetical protein
VTDWADVAANIKGVTLIRHAVITFNGTWGEGIVQYPGNVVDGLNQYVNDQLCVEIPCPYPASMGPLGGSVNAASYQQSVQQALDWTADWLAANPTRTFALGGYSQGAEAASRVLLELQSGSLTQFMPNFIGGYTFGNPSRGAAFHAPGIADPGGRGISATRITTLPTVQGKVVWADYVHSPANGDAALDMYASVPDNQVGQDMTDVYAGITALQFNDMGALAQAFVTDLMKDAQDLFPTAQSSNSSAWVKLLSDGMASAQSPAALALLLPDLLATYMTTDWTAAPTGLAAALDAAIAGIKFLAAPGGPTASHISYLGEIGGYSNLVAVAVGFLNGIATLTSART